MSIYFISDDKFYTFGVSSKVRQSDDYFFISANDVSEEFTPSADDIVVLFVENIEVRNRISRLTSAHKCKVILLLKMNGPVEYSGCFSRRFPWLVPHNMGFNDLSQILDKAKEALYLKKHFTEQETRLFHHLSCGMGINDVWDIGLSNKYRYALKRKVILKNKIRGHDAAAILACRDIIMLSQIFPRT